MTNQIHSLTDLESYFPSIQKLSKEWKSPCIFCPEEAGVTSTFKGHTFVGDDRLVWFLHSNRVYCRECQRQGRGRNGTYSVYDLCTELGLIVGKLKESVYTPIRQPLLVWDDDTVNRYHDNVDRSYWYELGWTDEVIDRFKLGRGYVSGLTNAHIIPMEVREVGTNHTVRWYGAGRKPDEAPRKLRGSISYYTWEIINNEDTDTVIIAEGEKDAVTASFLYPEYNVITAFGVTSWTFSKTLDLFTRGYKNVLVFQDNDDAGYDFAQTLIRGALERRIPLAISCLDWDEISDDIKDISDGLKIHEKDVLRDLFLGALYTPEFDLKMGEIDDSELFFTMSDSDETISLEALRAKEGFYSLHQRISEFITTYPLKYKRGSGRLFLLAAPPGAGKTQTALNIAEEFGRSRQIQRIRERVELRELLKDLREQASSEKDDKMIERIENKLENHSYASVAWIGQYKDGIEDLSLMANEPDYIFNFEGRSNENCDNYTLVEELGRNNHNIGTFCKIGCAYRDSCLESGYLKQEEDMKQRPITFFRHQHLASSYLTRGDYDLVVVDENPTSVVETPLLATQDDIMIHNKMVEDEYPEIQLLCTSLRSTMETLKTHELVVGSQLLLALNQQIMAVSKNEHNLTTLLEALPDDVIEDSQPNYISGDYVFPRVLPQLVGAIRKELVDFVEDPDNEIPSALNCVFGRLEIYYRTIAKIPKKTPVVILDATAFPKLYEAMFEREVETYKPVIRNNNANIVVLQGSDFTKSQVNRELSPFRKDMDKILKRTHVTNLLGKTYSLKDIKGDPFNIFNSPILRQTYQLAVAVHARHKKVLVVTHKIVREIMEHAIDIDGISWGHYGGLRGTNKYEDYPAVLLVGAYRVPYNVIYRKVSYWARLLGWLDPLESDIVRKKMLYHSTPEEGEYVTFDNLLLDQYVQMVEIGELIQSAERIRPHSSKGSKYVYIAANRPALTYTNTLQDKKEFIDSEFGSKEFAVYQYLRDQYLAQEEFPSYTNVVRLFNIGRSTISRLRKRVLEECNVEKEEEK